MVAVVSRANREARVANVGTLVLLLHLVVGCAHQEKLPPGMGRLIINCCEMPGVFGDLESGTCRPTLEAAQVMVDEVVAGTCADWAGSGRNVRAGDHRIEVRIPGDYPIRQGECCVEWVDLIEIRAAESRTVKAALYHVRYPD